jgi:hypothetical protein
MRANQPNRAVDNSYDAKERKESIDMMVQLKLYGMRMACDEMISNGLKR